MEQSMGQGYCQGQKKEGSQLSILWWMPNLICLGFGPAIKTGSARRFLNDTPQPIGEFQDAFPLLQIKAYPGLS